MSYLFNNQVTLTNLDAFGRNRNSSGFKLAEYTHIYNENSEMLYSLTGSGTYSFISNQATLDLQVGTGIGLALNQSRMYHHYQPGNSQLIFTSMNIGTPSTNTLKRVGYFDDRDGIFLQQSDTGTISFVERRYVTGTAVDINYEQSNWNKDKLDGTGPSKVELDFTKTQLMVIDFQWLGVGRLRCGFNHDGNTIIAHEVYHSNNLSTPYWSNPTLPIRYEIERTATASGSTTASLHAICSTVISEGGYDTAGYDFGAYTPQSVDISTPEEPTLIGALRLKNTFNGTPNRIHIRPGDFKLLSKFSNVRYEIWRLPSSDSVIGGSWLSAGDKSASEYNITATGFTTSGGDLLNVGFVNASVSGGGKGVDPTVSPSFTSISGQSAKKTFIAQNIDSTGSNLIAVVVTPLDGATASVHGGFTWREVY